MEVGPGQAEQGMHISDRQFVQRDGDRPVLPGSEVVSKIIRLKEMIHLWK